ncbi:unnamed protein product, partial [Polarella glacialis]
GAYVVTKLLINPPEPRPCPSEKQRQETFDGLAKKWDATVRSDEFFAGIGRARRRMIQRATGEVLEVAVGSGRNFGYYNAGKVTGVTAIDFSRSMLEVADQKRKDLEPIPLRLKLCSSQKMDFKDSSFDTIVDTFGVCSFEAPLEALREMRRVVKDDGQVLLLEHGASHWELFQGLLNRGAQKHVEKFGCYPNRDIAGLVKEAGLYILMDERAHFGTTYTLVCKKHPIVEDE